MTRDHFERLIDDLENGDAKRLDDAAVLLRRYRDALEHVATHTNRVVVGGTDESPTRRAQLTASTALYGEQE